MTFVSVAETQKALLRQSLLTPAFMMCSPIYFDPSIEAHGGVVANTKMGQHAVPEVAMAQWNGFKSKLEELGAQVLLVEPEEGRLDQVYTADPAAFHTDISLKDDGKSIEKIHFKSLLSRFTNAARQKEADKHLEATTRFVRTLSDASTIAHVLFTSTVEKTKFNTEGSGDNVYDTYRGMWWSGYVPNPSDPKNGRTDRRAHAQLEALTDRKVLGMHVKGDGHHDYFHIDTSHTPLPRGHVLSYEGGATQESLDIMRRVALADFGLPEDDYLIKVSREDAEKFACNLTAVTEKDLIVAHDLSDTLMSRLSNAGYNLHPLPYTEKLKGGGLFHCTANRINMIGPKGGTANDPDFHHRLEMALS